MGAMAFLGGLAMLGAAPWVYSKWRHRLWRPRAPLRIAARSILIDFRR